MAKHRYGIDKHEFLTLVDYRRMRSIDIKLCKREILETPLNQMSIAIRAVYFRFS